ncbi:MAG: alpha/beta fold hydrolase [Flavobacteriales bacterium]|nr:alpha/beta fold hydrolase [Flavobacteriales bacterium]
MLKRILIGLLILVLAAVSFGYAYIQLSAREFSDEETAAIKAAVNAPLQELVGEAGYAMNDGVKIWYDVHRPQDTIKGSVLLIMGLSADALVWPDFFYQPFVDSGYQVIRFDNRGVGNSDWNAFDPENPYTLSDMANDAIAVLDTLKIEKAHVVGASMGGMIGQTLCTEHPERAQSLTSIMSTAWADDPEMPAIDLNVFKQIGINTIKYGLSGDVVDAVKLRIAIRSLLMGSEKYDLDINGIAQLTRYDIEKRSGYNQQSGLQQTKAIEVSGSREEALKQLQTPTLVIHGKTDPLIPFAHGEKTAKLIPHAETLWIDGMGHTLPRMYADTMVVRMTALMANAGNSAELSAADTSAVMP